MQIQKVKIDMQGERYFRLFPWGDWHVGNANTDKEKILLDRDFILHNRMVYWIGMGDWADAIVSSDDRRYDPKCIDPKLSTPQMQYEWIEEIMAPVKAKCLGLHTGNHDDELRRRHFHDYVLGAGTDATPSGKQGLCPDLGVKYLGWDALTWLSLKNWGGPDNKGKNAERVYVIHSFHGSYDGDKMGGAVNRLVDFSADWDADIHLMGHTHWAHGWRHIRKQLQNHSKGGLRVVEKKLIYGLTGGYVRAYIEGTPSYLEKKGKHERKVGIISITIEPGRNDLHVTE